jgi:hypothetical protein
MEDIPIDATIILFILPDLANRVIVIRRVPLRDPIATNRPHAPNEG